MDLDQRLRDAARDVAEYVVAPAPATEAVQRRVRRARNVRLLAAAAAVAGCVGVAVGIGQLVGPEQRTPQPAGPDVVDLVWSDGTALHVRGDVVHVERELDVPIFGLTRVRGGVVFSTDPHRGQVYFRPDTGGDLVRLGRHTQAAPVGDPDSGIVAWFEARQGQGSLVVYDVSAGEELGRADVDVALRPEDNIIFFGYTPVLSVSEGEVYFAQNKEVWVYRWASDAGPESTGATPARLVDVANGVRAERSKGKLTFVRPDGSVVTPAEAGSYEGVMRSELNATGSLFATARGQVFSGHPAVVNTATGASVALDVSSAGDVPGDVWQVSWVDDATVALIYLDNRDATDTDVSFTATLVACDVVTGACSAETLPGDGFLVTIPGN